MNLVSSLPVLPVLHSADVLRDRRMEIPTAIDWGKIKKFLAGEWPQALPPYVLLDKESSPSSIVLPHIPPGSIVSIDTEYHPQTRELYVLGIGYRDSRGTIRGCVARWIELRWPVKEALTAMLRGIVTTMPVLSQNFLGAELPTLEKNLGFHYTDYFQVEDLMLAHATLWSEWPHDLLFIASLYSDYEATKHLSDEDIVKYNWGDVVHTLVAWEAIQKELEKDPLSDRVYRQQPLRLVPIVHEAHQHGLRVNTAKVEVEIPRYEAMLMEANKIAMSYAGYPLDISSPQQLTHFLYAVEEFPAQKDRETKQPTIKDEALTVLRRKIGPEPDVDVEEYEGVTLPYIESRIEQGAHPIIEARVLYAAAFGVLKYLRPMQGQERVYPQIELHAQKNSRWSYKKPPMAQLPVDLLILVMPDEGWVFLIFDHRGIELKHHAALAGDEDLLEAFDKGWDVHTLNVCDFYGWEYPPDKIDPHGSTASARWREVVKWRGKDDPRRGFVKSGIFKDNYGGSRKTGMRIPGAAKLGLTSQTFAQGMSRYFMAHPAIGAWKRKVQEMVLQRPGGGMAISRTFMGRRRPLLGKTWDAVREALDHPLQAGVVDIENTIAIQLKAAFPYMIYAYGRHDHQCWACPEEKVDETWPGFRNIVQQPWDINGRKVCFFATFEEQRGDQICPVL